MLLVLECRNHLPRAGGLLRPRSHLIIHYLPSRALSSICFINSVVLTHVIKGLEAFARLGIVGNLSLHTTSLLLKADAVRSTLDAKFIAKLVVLLVRLAPQKVNLEIHKLFTIPAEAMYFCREYVLAHFSQIDLIFLVLRPVTTKAIPCAPSMTVTVDKTAYGPYRLYGTPSHRFCRLCPSSTTT